MESKGGHNVKPLRTSIVRLRWYKKAGPADRDEDYRKFDALYKYNYLLSLTPDALQLYTTKDAGLFREAEDVAGRKKSFTSLVKKPVRMITGKKLHAAPEEDAAPPAPAAATSPREEGPLDKLARSLGASGSASKSSSATPPELDDDQVFTISVSLNQIVSVTACEGGKCLKVAFRPNKPSRKKMEEDTLTVVKAAFFPLWYPLEALVRDNWNPAVIMETHVRLDPNLHTFVIEAYDAEEAAVLKASLESAMERLAAALQWLSKDLPLLPQSSVSMITLDCPGPLPGGLAVPGAAAGAAGGDEARPKGERSGAQQAQQAQQRVQPQLVLATNPCFGDRVVLPDAVSADIAAAAAAAGAAGGGAAGGGTAGAAHALRIWLHTPLGPAQAHMVPGELLQDEAVAAGCPFTLRAAPSAGPAAGKGASQAPAAAHHTAPIISGTERRLEVLLRCCLVRGEQLPPGSPETLSKAAIAVETAAGGLHAAGSGGWRERLAGWDEGAWVRLLAILGILLVVLLNYSTLGVEAGPAAAGVLRSVSFMVTSLCGVAVIGIIARAPAGAARAAAAAGAGGGGAAAAGAAAGSPPLAGGHGYGRAFSRGPQDSSSFKGPLAAHPLLYRWHLELLEADLVERAGEEEAQALARAGAPPLSRTLSITAAPSKGPSKDAAALAKEVSGRALPMPIQHLLEQHPGLVNANIAERFLVGWGTPTQAYTGLVDMITWVQEQGLEGVVNQPQPKFELIKQHYRHAIVGRSKTDLPVEVEAMGGWKDAYEALRRECVTEQELLHHLVFIYEYTFTQVDARPMPHGRTVKIIDLDGLSMTDIRSDAVKFLTKVGALLNANYPQRLHRCFLVNAPTWWAVVWKMISPMIWKSTRERMCLFGKKDVEGMRKAILEEVAPDQLPEQYGGTCRRPLYESQWEQELLAHVRRVNGGGGEPAAECG